MVDETAQNVQFHENDLPELLAHYYRRIFPYKLYYQWLCYGEIGRSKYFSHREFSFTLKDDIYIRYQSFTDQKDLEKEIQKKCPYKIDIGAVFSQKPRDNKLTKANNFQAQEKELVFDIDMTDYDDIRSCCMGASICNKCWPLMTIAMKVIDKALEEDFGFEHRLWVYSGRRGVHCWVCDEAARKLSQTSRSAVAEYLSVIKGGENQLKKVNLPTKLHPSLWRASTILESDFKTLLLEKQDILSDKESWKKVLALIPDENVKKNLNQSWEKSQTSTKRWEILESEIDKKFSNHRLEIIFQYCYPRLDVNVTKGLNHLLKSPFCIHPKTGRVCVPIDITKVDQFDPFTVPTISQLCEEINDICQNTSNDENIPPQNFRGYKSLLLQDAMDVFERFILKLDKENHDRITRKKESNERTMEW